MCGVIKERFGLWEPHSQSGPGIPESCPCRISPSVGVYWTGSYFGGFTGVGGTWTDLCLARGPIQKEPELGIQLEMDLNPVLPWTSLSFSFVVGETDITVSLFQGCPQDIYQVLGQSMEHMVGVYAVAVTIITDRGSRWYILSETGGNSCCGLVFSGKLQLK